MDKRAADITEVMGEDANPHLQIPVELHLSSDDAAPMWSEAVLLHIVALKTIHFNTFTSKHDRKKKYLHMV